jgi:helix-turn-helix protein
VLKKHENRHTGRCYPSYQTVADITGLNRTTVIKYTTLLVTLGLINKQAFFIDGRQTSNRYSFCDLPARSKGGRIVPPPQDRVERSDPPGGANQPKPLPPNQTLTKKQLACPHKDTANLGDGVVYCRTCFANIESVEQEEENPVGYEGDQSNNLTAVEESGLYQTAFSNNERS